MSRKAKVVILAISLAIVTFTIAGGLGVQASSDDGAYRQLGVYSEVLSRIRSEYVEEPNLARVTDGALHGLLESLDANSSYLTAAEYKEYKTHRNEGKATIGATISKRFGYAAVVSVLPGGPADKAGMNGGDIIEAIEGKSTREMSLAEVNTLLAGQPGSTINLAVVRARRSEPQKLTITREIENVPAVSTKILEDQVGYLKISAFTRGKSQETASKIKALQNAGVKKLVLDLRDASLGEESEGVAVANLFLDHGIITYLQGQKYPRQTFSAEQSKRITDLPVVVLVNRGTAGPAEIVAAAIMENARGDVLGDKTFGVGSVQKTIDMPDGSALILSIAKYYSPSGKAIQDNSVTPNILMAGKDADNFALPDEDSEEGVSDQEPPSKEKGPDEQLRRAIEVLKNTTQK